MTQTITTFNGKPFSIYPTNMSNKKAERYFEKIKRCIDSCINLKQLDNVMHLVGNFHLNSNREYFNQTLMSLKLYNLVSIKAQVLTAEAELETLILLADAHIKIITNEPST